MSRIRKIKNFTKVWFRTSAQGRNWKHLTPSQKRATLFTSATTGVALGAGSGALISPKGKRKKGAGYGAAWGSVAGLYGGVGTGIYFRTRKKKRRKR